MNIPAHREHKMPHERKIVLLVDDDPEFLSELQEALASSGYIPLTATNGREAAKAARRIRPDAILLDLKLKGENGFTVAGRIRKNPATAHIPIIMMSGFFTGEEQANRLAPSSINIYLKKPFSQKDVVLSIQAVLADRMQSRFDPVKYFMLKT